MKNWHVVFVVWIMIKYVMTATSGLTNILFLLGYPSMASTRNLPTSVPLPFTIP